MRYRFPPNFCNIPADWSLKAVKASGTGSSVSHRSINATHPRRILNARHWNR